MLGVDDINRLEAAHNSRKTVEEIDAEIERVTAEYEEKRKRGDAMYRDKTRFDYYVKALTWVKNVK